MHRMRSHCVSSACVRKRIVRCAYLVSFYCCGCVIAMVRFNFATLLKAISFTGWLIYYCFFFAIVNLISNLSTKLKLSYNISRPSSKFAFVITPSY